MCEFTLNSINNASSGSSPAYVVFVVTAYSKGKPTLPLEYAVDAVTDGLVYSVTNCIANMESTLKFVRSAMTTSAAYMANYAN